MSWSLLTSNTRLIICSLALIIIIKMVASHQNIEQANWKFRWQQLSFVHPLDVFSMNAIALIYQYDLYFTNETPNESPIWMRQSKHRNWYRSHFCSFSVFNRFVYRLAFIKIIPSNIPFKQWFLRKEHFGIHETRCSRCSWNEKKLPVQF